MRMWRAILWVLVAVAIWWLWPWHLHRPIPQFLIARVEIEPKGSRVARPLPPEEARQVVAWFNAAGGVKNNSHHGAPGCGAHSHLNITLRTGTVISVASYMRVTRGRPNAHLDDLYADYYFRQPDLERYLRDWDRRAEAGGC